MRIAVSHRAFNGIIGLRKNAGAVAEHRLRYSCHRFSVFKQFRDVKQRLFLTFSELQRYLRYLCSATRSGYNFEFVFQLRFTGKVLYFYRYGSAFFYGIIVQNKNRNSFFAALRAHGKGRVKPLRRILQGFEPAEIIYRRPTCHRPTIVQLPIQRSPSLLRTAPCFRCVTDGFGLRQLTEVNFILELFRRFKQRRSIIYGFFVTQRAFLMYFHDVGEQIVFILSRIITDGTDVGEAFKAELAAKARLARTVIFDVLQSVPDRPQMSVADVIGFDAFLVVGADRRAGNVRSPCTQAFQFARQDPIEKVVCAIDIFAAGDPIYRHVFQFVIAAPQRQRRMVP